MKGKKTKKSVRFDTKPLSGKRILVTRTEKQASDLSRLLREVGAHVYEAPTIEIVPTLDAPETEKAIDKLPQCDWVVLTSVNGVKLFVQALRDRGDDVRLLAGKKIAAIGPATAAAIEELGLKVNLLPDEYRAEALAEALGKTGVAGKKFLLARARVARDILPKKIVEMGGEAIIAPVYETHIPEGSAERLKEILEKENIDLAIFTSSSTVRNFIEMTAGTDLSNIRIACIGPITASTAREAGLEVHIQPNQYTIPALVEAIIKTGLS